MVGYAGAWVVCKGMGVQFVHDHKVDLAPGSVEWQSCSQYVLLWLAQEVQLPVVYQKAACESTICIEIYG